MRALLPAVISAALLLPPVAEARDWRGGFGAYVQAQDASGKKGPPPAPHGDRDKRAGHDKRHQGRLTREERRELHRDLDRANREIYRR